MCNRSSSIPKVTSFTSLLSFILHMRPNRFSFLSMICCTMFFMHHNLLCTSSFVIFCSHLILNILLQHFISNASDLSLPCFFNVYGGHCINTSRSRVGGSHRNVTKRDGGGWVGWAERDVTPTINLGYEFYNCCCQTNQSRICCWQKVTTALPILKI